MRILNVITVKNGIVDDVQSFGIFEEQLSEDVTEIAEKVFIKSAKEIGFVETDEDDADAIIEEGYYQIANASVCLTWSSID
jgi:hypothetical protein